LDISYINTPPTPEKKQIKIVSDRLAVGGLAKGSYITGGIFREKFENMDHWETVGVFTDTGEPALITRAIGKGRVYLAATNLGLESYEKPSFSGGFWSAVIKTGGIEPAVSLPSEVRSLPVEAQLHKTINGKYILYLINWSRHDALVPVKIRVAKNKPKAVIAFPENEKGVLTVTRNKSEMGFSVLLKARNTKVVIIE
jgi:hypothetical protein